MLYLLYEQPLGLALFKKKEYDEVAAQTEPIIKAIKSQETFSKMVKMKAFTAYPNQDTSIEVIKGLLSGQITPFLQEFLDNFFPSSKKKAVLAVQETKLAKNLSSNLGIKCTNSPVVHELYRGIRTHFNNYIKGKIDSSFVNLTQACVGMSHAVQRNLIKFDVKRNDKPIIQSYSLIDQMDKNLNTFAMRLKEWYGWHFPELVKHVPVNELYTKVCKYVGNRNSLSDESIPELEELVGDGEIAEAILKSQRNSVGNDLSEIDEECLINFCNYLVSHYDYKNQLQGYLKEKLDHIQPNLSALVGESMGAKLITHAGGVSNLSRLPASTIQILGAEKALFRALKKKGNTPKYGFIYNSSFISRADMKDKGKVSRVLANKCSLAVRLDAHLLKPTNRFGIKMREEVEKRLEQLKNNQKSEKKEGPGILEEVCDELEADGFYVFGQDKKSDSEAEGKLGKRTKKKKKKKKVKEESQDEEEVKVVKKKKKKKGKKDKKKKKKKVVVSDEDED